MANIFFSYRKQGEDKPSSLRLADNFRAALGDDAVFRDETGLEIGRFEDQLLNQLQSCEIMAVVIGPTWIERISDLNNDKDWVRRELEIGLERGIEIAPILVEGARQPAQSDLPPSLANLYKFQFSAISSKHWKTDVDDLIDAIAKKLNLEKQEVKAVQKETDPMSKNVILCLDGTGNQYGEDLSNIVKLFRMAERTQGAQVAYYDPGVGTMGDPIYKTLIARKVNKVLGLAFGRGLTKNLIEAYSYLMEHYENGDKIFLFGFSRGACTARLLAAFLKQCGLFEKRSENLIPYAMKLFLKKEKTENDFRLLSGFRSTYGRQFKKVDDPKYPDRKEIKEGNPNHWQLRIHFLGLFDTVNRYGWVRNPVKLSDESKNPSVLHVRHALAIDERRIFFRQLHWISSPGQDCKEVWFPGVHSDVGGGYPEKESGLSKIALEWMVHEACTQGMKVDPYRYNRAMGRNQNEKGEWVNEKKEKYPAPDATAAAHESLKGAWRAIQLLPKSLDYWEKDKRRRTIKAEKDRPRQMEAGKKPPARGQNPLLMHQSVLDRMNGSEVETITTPNPGKEYPKEKYRPENLLESLPGGDPGNLTGDSIEQTRPEHQVFQDEAEV